MMKNNKLLNSLLGVSILLGCISCKPEVKIVEKEKTVEVEKIVTVEVEPKEDSVAPAAITNLSASARNAQVLLTWTDATDEDIFGYEVNCSEATYMNRAISAPAKNSMIVSQGAGGCFVSNLSNGIEYTFTVTTIDKSGNKSSGVSVTATPTAAGTAEAMNISLTPSVPHLNGYTGDKSKTTVTITVNIESAGSVEKVVCKKNGSVNARTLLADPQAFNANPTADNKVWEITLGATNETVNGTYTVAAIDEDGREEVGQIVIDQFDFTPPAKVKSVTGEYTSESSIITLNWTNPADTDYDHVEITYTTNDGIRNSEPSQAIIVTNESNNKIFNEIDGSKAYYTYNFVTYDALGNKGKKHTWKVSVGTTASNVPEGFVEVAGMTVTGAVENSGVFINGRTVVIPDLWVCEHEVTQKEYSTYCHSYYSNPLGDNYPADTINWYDTVIYCNLRSIAESLTPVYIVNGETDPTKWSGVECDSRSKYSGPFSSNSILNSITFDATADGYRLPTEAEWEYIARGGSALSTNKYSGTDSDEELTNYAWYNLNSNSKPHEVCTKTANSLGIYDITGNVFEWCWDWCDSINPTTGSAGPDSGTYRSFRGGSWQCGPFLSDDYTLYRRAGIVPQDHCGDIGFRVIRNAQ